MKRVNPGSRRCDDNIVMIGPIENDLIRLPWVRAFITSAVNALDPEEEELRLYESHQALICESREAQQVLQGTHSKMTELAMAH